jgi:REP element-mobilizing transposase RayT
VHDTFIQFALRAAEHRVCVGRYVIMPDHIHLFAGFGPESISVSAWMKSFQKRDLEGPEKRDFSRAALAEGFLRSCHSIPGVV